MSTFFINNGTDWRIAIADSQTATPSYTTYKLASNITFTDSNRPYLNNGNLDTDWLYIRSYSGVSQVFDGNYYTITLSSLGSVLMAGLFRIVGQVSQNAIVQNLFLYNNSSSLTLNPNFGALIASSTGDSTSYSSTGAFNPSYVTLQNCIVYTTVNIGTLQAIGFNYYSFSSITNVTVTNCVFQSNTSVSGGMLIGTNGYPNNPCYNLVVSNCYFLLPSTTSSRFSAIGPVGNTSTITNVYVYFSSQAATPNTANSGIIFSVRSGGTLTITNMYVVYNTYSSTYTNYYLKFIFNNAGTTTLNNVYANSDISVAGSGSLTGSINTNFTWSTSPTFSSPNGFDNSSPNLLSVFTASPFQSSAYTVFSSLAAFSSTTDPPCLCRGMKILTPDGPRVIESLVDGDAILAPPFHRPVLIQKIFSRIYIGTPDNIPVRIPVDFFEPGLPSEDILLSPNHGVFYNGEWIFPVHIDGLSRETSFLGKEFTYYHICLPNYAEDKLWCHDLPVDSWDLIIQEPL